MVWSLPLLSLRPLEAKELQFKVSRELYSCCLVLAAVLLNQPHQSPVTLAILSSILRDGLISPAFGGTTEHVAPTRVAAAVHITPLKPRQPLLRPGASKGNGVGVATYEADSGCNSAPTVLYVSMSEIQYYGKMPIQNDKIWDLGWQTIREKFTSFHKNGYPVP